MNAAEIRLRIYGVICISLLMVDPYCQKLVAQNSPTTSTSSNEKTDRYWSYDEKSGYMQIDADAVLADLKHEDWHIKQNAVQAIIRLGPRKSVLEFRPGIADLVDALKSDDASLRQSAANCLAQIAADATVNHGVKLPELEPAIELLSDLVRSSEPSTRFWAVVAIGPVATNVGPETVRRVIPVLVWAANDPDSNVSEHAIAGLGRFGRDARSAVPMIVEKLEAHRSHTNVAAIALGKIATDPELCVPALVRALRVRTEPETQLSIVRALAQFGPHAEEALPLLIPRLNLKIPVINQLDQRAQWTAAFAIAQIGPAAVEAIPALEEAFNSVQRVNQDEWDRNVQLSTFAALCAVGPDSKERAVELSHDLQEFTIRGKSWLLNNPLDVWSLICKAPNLTRLDLSGSEFKDSDLEPLSSMDQLTHLALPVNTTDAGLRHISGLDNVKLQSLEIGRPVTDEELTFLLDQEKRVRQPITDNGLQQLIRLHNLRALSIPFADLTDDGMRHLQHFSLVETLHVGGQRVTDQGLTHLSHMKHLKELDLRGTGVSDRGVTIIANNHPSLESLDLSHCKITSACVNDLSKLKQLRSLRVTATPLARGRTKSSSVLILEKSLPECRVRYDN